MSPSFTTPPTFDQPVTSDRFFDFTEVNTSDAVTGTMTSSPMLPVILSAQEICRRLSPPPIPPWLYESPEKLRLLVANCSAWKKYVDLCSAQLPPEYPQVLALYPGAEGQVSQWIPTIVVLLLVVFILVGSCCLYGRYKNNRLKLPIAEYHKCTCRDSHHGNRYHAMSTSSTVETQLSAVCGSSPEHMYPSSLPPPHHLIYSQPRYSRPDLHGWGSTLSVSTQLSYRHSLYDTTGPLDSARAPQHEIILLPKQLGNDESLYPAVYASGMSSSSDYYSSLSLPAEAENRKTYTESMYNTSQDSKNNDDYEEYDIDDLSYVQIHPTPSTKPEPHKGQGHGFPWSRVGPSGVRHIVARCRKAGAALLHGNKGNNRDFGGQKSSRRSFSTKPKSPSTLRESPNPNSPKEGSPNSANRNIVDFHQGVPTSIHEACSDVSFQDGVSSSGTIAPVILTANAEPSGVLMGGRFSRGRKIAAAKLRDFGHFVRTQRQRDLKPFFKKATNRAKLPEPSSPDSDFSYVSDTFEICKDSDSKGKSSRFKKLRQSSILRKIKKRRSGFLHSS